MAVDLCLPLTKFSHALGLDANHTVPWTHITSNNIYVTLKGHVPLNEAAPLTMTIVQGTASLDVLDLTAHLALAHHFQMSKEHAGLSYKVEQLPIFGIKRDIVVAIRYYIDGKACESTVFGQARRMQLAMKSVEDCERITQVLSLAGLQFKDPPRTATRPTTATSNEPQSLRAQDIPSSAQSSAHFPPQSNNSQPSPFSLPSMDVGSLSQRPQNQPGMNSASTSDRGIFARDEALLPQSVEPLQPVSHEFLGSRSLHPPPRTSFAGRQQTSTLASERVRHGLDVGNRDAVQRDFASSDTKLDMRPYTGTLQLQENISSDTFTGSTYHTPLHSGRLEPPSSSGLSNPSLANLETLEDEIPPRRELPFKVPGSRGSNPSRPGSSALSLPPLKRPTTADDRSATNAARPQTAASKSLNRPGKQAKDKRPSTAHSTTQSIKKNQQPVQSSLSFTAGKYSLKPLNAISASTSRPARMSSLIDAPHELETPPDGAWSSMQAPAQNWTHSGTAPENGIIGRDPIGEAYAALSTSHSGQDTSSLEEYAAQDGKTRQTVLEQFMMDNLQNPSFTTLCEDVESCWRRIALGL